MAISLHGFSQVFRLAFHYLFIYLEDQQAAYSLSFDPTNITVSGSYNVNQLPLIDLLDFNKSLGNKALPTEPEL